MDDNTYVGRRLSELDALKLDMNILQQHLGRLGNQV